MAAGLRAMIEQVDPSLPIGDASRERYVVKKAFAGQVAGDKGKLAPGVVSFIGPLFQCCGHPGAAFGPEFPPSREQLR